MEPKPLHPYVWILLFPVFLAAIGLVIVVALLVAAIWLLVAITSLIMGMFSLLGFAIFGLEGLRLLAAFSQHVIWQYFADLIKIIFLTWKDFYDESAKYHFGQAACH